MNVKKQAVRGIIAFTFAGLVATGCKDTPTGPGVLASIVVTPNVTLAINATQQYVAVGMDANSNIIPITPTWSIAAGGGAISAGGLFTAGTASGTFAATVKATSGSISGVASVTINAGALATLTVTPNPNSMTINSAQQYAVVGRDASANTVAITPVWSVVAGGGTISAAGMFTAGSVAGTYNNSVRATVGSINGNATVTVTPGALSSISVSPNSSSLPANAPQQFSAVGKDAGNNVVSISATWSVVAGGGNISGTGLFTAGSVAGTFANTVRAASGIIAGTASVTVNVASGSHGPAPVNLGSASNYVILAKSAISTVPTSAITGNLGLSPSAASFITGFSLILPAGGAFSSSSQVTGNVYASDYAVPTPSNLTTAISDMETAYTDAAGRVTPDYTELASGAIGGLTLPAGLYKWSNTVTINSDVTLSGGATDVWIFQIAGGITQASAANVILTGGALASNIFWQTFGAVDIGTVAHMEGQILSQTSINLQTGASANGRLLAQTAVTLAGNAVVQH